MSLKLQLILILIDSVVLVLTVNRIRNGKLLLQHSLSWLSLLVVILVVALFPDVLGVTAEFLGIYSSMNMVFFLGFCFSLILIFGLTQSISKMTEQIKDLTQKIALLEKKITEQERDNSNN